MASNTSQLLPCGCKDQFHCSPLCNVFLSSLEDKRLFLSSHIDQPTYLKFPKKYQLERIRARSGRSKDSLAGYNSFRGDFEIEYNDRAEHSVVLACQLEQCSQKIDANDVIEKDEEQLVRNLQVALCSIYNSNLKERERRKSIIRKHGLMNTKGTDIWYTRLEANLGKSQAKKMIRYSFFTSADEMELLSSSLELINAKRAEVNKLTYHRTQRGITSKWDVEIFERERHKRDTYERRNIQNSAVPQTSKKKKSCIDIFHLPRFRELSPKEVELCQSNNLSPSQYLDVKDTLVSDCKKNKGLLLKRARKLVKIDVNKTRKIYDLLLEEGYTWAPAQQSIKK